MQEKDNIYSKNYKTENRVVIIKRKVFRKIGLPVSLRKKLLNVAHRNFAHPDIQKFLNLIYPNYYWPYKTQDITQFV